MIEEDFLILEVKDIGILRVARTHSFENGAEIVSIGLRIFFKMIGDRFVSQAGVSAHFRMIGEKIGEDHGVLMFSDH